MLRKPRIRVKVRIWYVLWYGFLRDLYGNLRPLYGYGFEYGSEYVKLRTVYVPPGFYGFHTRSSLHGGIIGLNLLFLPQLTKLFDFFHN